MPQFGISCKHLTNQQALIDQKNWLIVCQWSFLCPCLSSFVLLIFYLFPCRNQGDRKKSPAVSSSGIHLIPMGRSISSSILFPTVVNHTPQRGSDKQRKKAKIFPLFVLQHLYLWVYCLCTWGFYLTIMSKSQQTSLYEFVKSLLKPSKPVAHHCIL